MSTSRKLSKPGSAMTRLKTLPRADREIIWGWLQRPDMTLTQIRERVRKDYDISLNSDSSLSRFRDWMFLQLRNERLNDWTEEFEEELKKFNPSAGMDKVREFTIATLLKEAVATGDKEFALQVYDRDLKERQGKTVAQFKEEELLLNREKFAWMKKDDLEKALDALHDEIKDNAEALQAFQRFKGTISKAQKA